MKDIGPTIALPCPRKLSKDISISTAKPNDWFTVLQFPKFALFNCILNCNIESRTVPIESLWISMKLTCNSE